MTCACIKEWMLENSGWEGEQVLMLVEGTIIVKGMSLNQGKRTLS